MKVKIFEYFTSIAMLIFLVGCMQAREIPPMDHLLPAKLKLDLPPNLELSGSSEIELWLHSLDVNGDKLPYPEYVKRFTRIDDTITFTPPSIGHKTLSLKLYTDTRLIARHDGPLTIEPGKELKLGSIKLDSIPFEEQAADLNISVALIEKPSLGSDSDTFFSVSDIFDTYNCTVCHGEQEFLNLRSYPFTDSNRSNQQILENIIKVVESGAMPPKNLRKVSEKDLDRLRTWIAAGAKPDPQPNQKSPSSAQIRIKWQLSFSEVEPLETLVPFQNGFYFRSIEIAPHQFYDIEINVELDGLNYHLKRKKVLVENSKTISEIIRLGDS